MAQFLLLTTLLSLAGILATSIMGFLARPGNYHQHIYFALATVVLALFSQSMTMFFFIGTGKEIKDKVKGAAEEGTVVQRTKDFKSKVFPAAMWAMTFVMVLFIMGGGVATGKTSRWLHLGLTIATIVMYARAYWIQLQAMDENAKLMETYLAD
jgi:hypothetical protein